MRNPIPPMTETVDELTLRLQQERDGRTKPRLQMRSLLATGQARERQEAPVAHSERRNTVGRWLAVYAAGGLAAVLAIRTAPGKPRSRSPVALAALEPARRQPVGFSPPPKPCASGCAPPIRLTSRTRRWTPSSERASRPNATFRVRAIKTNPDALTAVRRDCGAHLAAAIPAGDPRPIRVFSQDERRCGLLTIRRRRLTARGVQPVGSIQHGFQSWYLSGAVAPTSGERFFLASPALNADQFQRLLDAFSQAFAASRTILALDKSGAHPARRLTFQSTCGWGCSRRMVRN